MYLHFTKLLSLSSTSSSFSLSLKTKNENFAMKVLRKIIASPLNLTVALFHRHLPSSLSPSSFFSSESAVVNQLTRLPSLLEGCDYEHLLVIMEAPNGYPLRDEIVSGYVKTLAMALGSEEEAKKSIYSVSTNYYYPFGCKVPEDLTYKIRPLPNVIWVWFCQICICVMVKVATEVVPYDDKYHTDWIWDQPLKQSQEKKETNK